MRKPIAGSGGMRATLEWAFGPLTRQATDALHSPTLSTLGVFAGGNLLVSIVGGIVGILQASWVAPEVLGEFRQYGILTSYLYIGLVFVQEGLVRQYPYLIGKGEGEEALRVAASAKWGYLILAWLCSLLFGSLAVASAVRGEWRATVGWAAQISCIWAAFYGAYLGVIYRSSLEFGRLSCNNVLSTLAGLPALALVKVWGYWGLAARFVLQSALNLYVNHRRLLVKVKAACDVKRLVALAKISLPLSVPGYIHTSCLSASLSVIILAYRGQAGLGVWGVALLFQGVAVIFTNAVNQIFFVRLTGKFGETNNIRSCLRYARTPTLLNVLAALLLCAVLCLVIGPFINLFLPQYAESIAIVRILSLSLPLSAASLPLVILKAALCYKSLLVVALTRFAICMIAVAVLPKTLAMIAACTILGEIGSLATGYGMLAWRRRHA